MHNQLRTNVSSLTFTPSNWNIPQTITVSAVNDNIAEGMHQGAINFTISTTDPNYASTYINDIPVKIADNDSITGGIRNYVQQSETGDPFKDIDVGNFSNPALVDIDGDLDLDLLVGDSNGKIRYYENTGTITAPVFAERRGTPFDTSSPYNPFWKVNVGNNFARPAFADVSGDGYPDLVVGAADGTLSYFKNNTFVNERPFFSPYIGENNNPFYGIDVGSLSSPALADIDDDADADLVVGSWDGTLKYYKNIGTFVAPKYIAQSGGDNPFNGIAVGANSSPLFLDVDNDGDYDLLLGENNGNFSYYQNVGTRNNPIFALQSGSLFYGISGGTYASPALGDLNADGAVDGIVGNSDGTIKYFLNQSVTPPSGPTVSFNGTDLNIDLGGGSLNSNLRPLGSSLKIVNKSNNANADPVVVVSTFTFTITGVTLANIDTTTVSNNILNVNSYLTTRQLLNSLRIINIGQLQFADYIYLPALVTLESQAIATASSSDPGALQAALLNILLQAANKPLSQQSNAERLGLDWLGNRVKQNKIDEAQKALDLYNYWTYHPYTRDRRGNLLADRYQTPQGFGFSNYDVVAPSGLASLTGPPYPPDVRRDAKAILYRTLALDPTAQLSSSVTAKGLSRIRQDAIDGTAVIQSLFASGADQPQIGATIFGLGLATGLVTGAVATVGVTAAVAVSASSITAGTFLFGSAAGLVGVIPGVAGSVATIIGSTSAATGSAFYTASAAGVASATFSSLAGASVGAVAISVGLPVVVVLAGVAAAAGYGVMLFGSSNFGVEGSRNIPINLQNELRAAQNLVPDLKTLLQSQTGTNDVFTAFMETTIGKSLGTLLNSNNNNYVGTVSNDTIYGLGGNDTIAGGDGNDRMDGGQGRDNLYGGAGNDFLDGDEESDWLEGDAGNDVLRGWKGFDNLYGDNGDDSLYGEEDNDVLVGGGGNDVLNGGAGSSDVAGYTGNYGEYRITRLITGAIEVRDVFSGRDDTDYLTQIERLDFRNGSYQVKDLRFPTFALINDDFITNINTTNVRDYNLAARQTGSLETINWATTGNAQIGNTATGIFDGNYLLLADGATAALDRNFNGATAQGGLRISFELAPNSTGADVNHWGAFSLGLSADDKNKGVNAAAPHFGILFRGNGGIQVFDGSIDITSSNLATNPNSSWGGTGNDGTFYNFNVVATDPTDNNPFNGIGQTNINVYAEGNLIYSYIKRNGGYSNNYVNFSSIWRSGVDNVSVENLNSAITAVSALVDTFTVASTSNTADLNYNKATRQTGLFSNTNWIASDATKVKVGDNGTDLDSGNYLLITDTPGGIKGTAALDLNLNGTKSQGGLRFSFGLAPNLGNSADQNVWGSFSLGLSATDKNAFVNIGVPHFGILFRGNGGIQAFDGSTDVTGQNLAPNPSNSWGGTSNGATLQPFSVVATDPGDNNPFDGVGQTNIEVYWGANLIYRYIKKNGGYANNYINFGSISRSAVDNFRIDQLNLGTGIINFAENGTGTVYTATANDPNGGQLSYRLFGLDSDLFNINSRTGAITFKEAPNYEAPRDVLNDNVYAVQVIASNGVVQSTKTYSIAVTDVNDAPQDISLSNSTVQEGSAVGTIIGNLLSADDDPGNTFNYALVSGNGSDDNSSFTLVNNQLRLNTVPNFETQSIYSIRVRTTDQGGASYEKALTVTILDVNERPTNIGLSTNNINESITRGSVIATLDSADPDINNTFTYNLVVGAGSTDNSLFSIVANQLIINTTPNRQVKSSYSIRVRTTDQGGLSYERSLTLNVNDRNQAPGFALLTDNFTAPRNPNTFDLNYNRAGRQGGSLAGLNWVASGNTQVGNITAGIDGGNYLLTAYNGTAALDYNFDGVNSAGGLRISFNLAPNSTNLPNQMLWGGISLGLSSLSKNAFINDSARHFGILFRGNGEIQAFDGNQDVTGVVSTVAPRIWGATGNDATLYPFTLIATDPGDGNPFDGVGQTNIYVYSGNSLIYQYVKGGGGYADNYINFGSVGISGVDDLRIEKLGLVTFPENGTGTVYTASATDPDGTNLTYSLSGTDSNRFNINSATGAIAFNTPPNFKNPGDAGSNNIYDVTVTAFDGVLSASQPVTVLVTRVNQAPTALNLSSTSVNEKVPANTVIGSFSTTDPDPGDPFVYTLVGGVGSNDNGAFTINGNQLQINSSPVLSKPNYNIRVRSTDGGGLHTEDTFAIAVNEINEAPDGLFLNISGPINEDIAPGSVIGNFTTTDPDSNNTFTYGLSDGAGAINNNSFTINGNQLIINSAPAGTGYSIRVQTTDQGGLPLENTFSIGVNRRPFDISLSSSRVNESISPGTVVGTLSSADPDNGNVFTYSLVTLTGGNDNGAFSINGNQLIINTVPNFNTKPSYSLQIRTTDQGGLSYDKSLTIDVNNVNDPPTITSSTADVSVAENNAGVVYTIAAIDPDSGTTLTYSLGGADANLFNVDSSAGMVMFRNPPNFELPLDSNGDNIYDLILNASDGSLSDSEPLKITVTDVNESPTITGADTVNFAENGTGVVYTITGTDPDAGTTLIYSALGTDADKFNVNSNTGEISFKNVPDFELPGDSNRDNIYNINVVASDGNLASIKPLTITITNVYEAPVINGGDFASVVENTTGIIYKAGTTTDADPTITITYSLFGGDSSLFAIDAVTGEVSFKAAPDFEKPLDTDKNNIYNINLRAYVNDEYDGIFVVKPVIINVSDINEAPTALVLNNGLTSVAENVGNVKVADIAIVDDALGTNALILSGADAASFVINDNALYFVGPGDYESGKTSYSVTISASDGSLTDSGPVSASFSLNITNTNDITFTINPIGGLDSIISAAETSVPITGNMDAAATSVTLAIAGVNRNATLNGTTWSYILDGSDLTRLGQGTGKTITAAAQDGANNLVGLTSATFGIDTIAPAKTATVISMTKDTGISAADFITNDGTAGRTYTGNIYATLIVGETVQISVDGGNTWEIAPVSGRTWNFTDNIAKTGNWTIQTRIMDAAGNTGAITLKNVTLDAEISASELLGLDLLSTNDTGISSTDNITRIAKPVFAVSFEPAKTGVGDLIEICNGNDVMGSTRLTTSAGVVAGTVNVVLRNALTNGLNTLSLRQRDRAGNTVTGSTTLDVTYDNQISAPGTVTLDLLAASDSGISSTDNITNINLPGFTLGFDATKAQAGDIIEIRKGNVVLGRATLDDAGVGSGTVNLYLSTPLTRGLNQLTAVHRDTAGNLASSPLLGVLLDNIAPSAPLVSGYSLTGVNGTAEPNVTILLSSSASSSVNFTAVETQVNPGGNYSLDIAGVDGSASGVTYYLYARDAAGNFSSAGNARITIGSSGDDVLTNVGGSSSDLLAGASGVDTAQYSVVNNVISLTGQLASATGSINIKKANIDVLTGIEDMDFTGTGYVGLGTGANQLRNSMNSTVLANNSVSALAGVYEPLSGAFTFGADGANATLVTFDSNPGTATNYEAFLFLDKNTPAGNIAFAGGTVSLTAL